MATVTRVPSKAPTDGAVSSWPSAAGNDRCPRCGGLMIAEPGPESLDDMGLRDYLVRRCVQCGEVIDPVILMNRRQASHRIEQARDHE